MRNPFRITNRVQERLFRLNGADEIEFTKRRNRSSHRIWGGLVAAAVVVGALKDCGGPGEEATASLQSLIKDGQVTLSLNDRNGLNPVDVLRLSPSELETRVQANLVPQRGVDARLSSPHHFCLPNFKPKDFSAIRNGIAGYRPATPGAGDDKALITFCDKYRIPVYSKHASLPNLHPFVSAAEAEKPVTMIVTEEHNIDPFRLAASLAERI